MPTYEDLRGYFEDSAPLRAVVRRAAEVPIVRGFALDVDPLWAACYDRADRLIDADTLAEQAHYWRRWGDWPGAADDLPGGDGDQGFRRRNLHRDLPDYDALLKQLRPAHAHPGPVRLTIAHAPCPPPLTDDPADSEDNHTGWRQQLLAIARDSPAPVRVEARPRAGLYSNAAAGAGNMAGGDGIIAHQPAQSGQAGTYGGTLTDSSGHHYGLTCAHVAGLGDRVDDGTGRTIGICAHATALVALAGGSVCDPVSLRPPVPMPGNGPDLNMLDLALLDLRYPPAANAATGIAAALTPGMNVVVHGARSQARCKLGALALSYAFTAAGRDYCFRDSIELIPRPRVPVGGALGRLTARVPGAGDSGAWVLTDDPKPIWTGVFFGGDGQRGFAVRASWAHTWAQQQSGRSLHL